jgi:methionyl-tRNA formyltransferase
LKLLLITQGVWRVLEPLLASPHKVVGIIESAPRGYKKPGNLRKLLTGLKEFLNVATGKPMSLRRLCRENEIPYWFMTASSDDGLEDRIRKLCPDLIVVFSMSQLLKANIFSIPRLGTINLHPSYLPDYRGPNPDFWQYYDMELNPGVTVHYVDVGEDTGDIILQERVCVPLGIKSPERLDLLIGKVGVRLLLQAIQKIERGEVIRKPQPKDSPTIRARNLRKIEHISIIDWAAWPIERIWHVMRGTELWLDCIDPPRGLYRGQRWIVDGYVKAAPDRSISDIGTVKRDNNGFYVNCRDGQIRLIASFNVKNLLRPAYRKFVRNSA